MYATATAFPLSNSRVVLYKSERAYMKTVKQCKVEMSKEVLQRLKQVRDSIYSGS